MEPTLQEVFSGVAIFLVAYYFRELSKDLKSAVASVEKLNTKVGVIIERTDTHTTEISTLREKTDTLTSDVAHIKAHFGNSRI